MKTGIILIAAGFLCYFGNIFLIKHYLNKNMPGVFDLKGKHPNGEYAWEKTAGKGFVPKWISLVGVLAWPLIVIGTLMIVYALWA